MLRDPHGNGDPTKRLNQVAAAIGAVVYGDDLPHLFEADYRSLEDAAKAAITAWLRADPQLEPDTSPVTPAVETTARAICAATPQCRYYRFSPDDPNPLDGAPFWRGWIKEAEAAIGALFEAAPYEAKPGGS
jgi:hypothetical protein